MRYIFPLICFISLLAYGMDQNTQEPASRRNNVRLPHKMEKKVRFAEEQEFTKPDDKIDDTENGENCCLCALLCCSACLSCGYVMFSVR